MDIISCPRVLLNCNYSCYWFRTKLITEMLMLKPMIYDNSSEATRAFAVTWLALCNNSASCPAT